MSRRMAGALGAAAVAMAALSPMSARADDQTNICIIATTDVHGNFFPYNFITRKPWGGSMARVCAYVDSVRSAMGSENVILLDNGDILQGQPTVYYYNFVDTDAQHIVPRVYHFMGYDAATVGNHDIETGHAVYDRWHSDCSPMPLLGANVIDTDTGKPYFTPYTVIERQGVRIAVLGMLTPAIPAWLPQNLWAGMEFEDMEESARKWVDKIRNEADAHVVIGLFHSGADSSKNTAGFNENAAIEVARNVGGFDAVLFGHDHRLYNASLLNNDGEKVVALNPANNAMAVARIDIAVNRSDGRMDQPVVSGSIVRVDSVAPSQRFLDAFEADSAAVAQFVDRTVGYASGDFVAAAALNGPSPFMSLLHRLQLDVSGAEISFAAPLSMDARIAPGPLKVSDLFSLYKYENQLCVLNMSGSEIKDYLEMSYEGWCNPALDTPCYNLDSAAGIAYTVNPDAPKGERVTIVGMADGTPFDMERIYTVAMNTYRSNGGGNLLTLGAGIAREEIPHRIIRSTDRDLRYHLLEQIEREKRIEPVIIEKWRFNKD